MMSDSILLGEIFSPWPESDFDLQRLFLKSKVLNHYITAPHRSLHFICVTDHLGSGCPDRYLSLDGELCTKMYQISS